MFNLPFFAHGIMSLPVVFDETVPRACTDGKQIRFNTEWFDSLKTEEINTVLCHEVCHLLFGHLWRAPSGADSETWNIACDHAVNNMMREFSEEITKKGLADPLPWPSGFVPVMDKAFAGMAEENIYSRINRPKPPQPQPKPGKGKPGKGQGQGPSQPGQGQPQPGQSPQPQQGQGRPDAFGEFEIQNPTKPDQKDSKEHWESVLIRSAAIAKGKGKLPGSMARLVKELLEPTVPWFQLLRQWLREQASDDWNWQKANLYYAGSDFILPVLESEKIGPVVFAKDSSGSIDSEALAHFVTEQQTCLDDLRPRKLVDIVCDTRITKVKEYNPGDRIDPDAPGGGGTDFRPVFEYIDRMDEQPKCLVFLTDTQGTFPQEAPAYPVLWVSWAKDQSVPFGTLIYGGAE